MKLGLRYYNTGRCVDPKEAVALAQVGEEAGFESHWTVEHTVVPANYASRYPYSEDGRWALRQTSARSPNLDDLCSGGNIQNHTRNRSADPAAAQPSDHSQASGHARLHVGQTRHVGYRRWLA